MRCEFCNKDTQIKKVQKYQYIESGLKNIFLDNIEIRFCENCDLQSPIIPKILKLHNTIGFAIVCKSGALSGSEIKFLRKNLRIKSQDWAKLLRSKKETISRWENSSQTVGSQTDLLIRLLYLRIMEERKDIGFNSKIVENLSEVNNTQTSIIIDAEAIESFSYLPFEEALYLSETQNIMTVFDFELDESNYYLSEIEKPLLPETIKDYRSGYFATANQELALAA